MMELSKMVNSLMVWIMYRCTYDVTQLTLGIIELLLEKLRLRGNRAYVSQSIPGQNGSAYLFVEIVDIVGQFFFLSLQFLFHGFLWYHHEPV